MSIQFKSIYPEKSRTASPDDSEAIEIAATGANYVRAIWRLVSGSGGSSDQTGNLKAQHSNDTVDWDDVPGGAFNQVSQGSEFPVEQELIIYPNRKWLRWSMTHAGTTKIATWGLMNIYHK